MSKHSDVDLHRCQIRVIAGKGKKQIVIGLLTNSDGMPVAVRVFNGSLT